MKVSALSFLRLGDFLHHWALLKPLINEGHEVTVLGFTELASIAPLFPELKFHLLHRSEIQSDLVERDHPWYRAALSLEKYLAAFAEQSCDLLLNLSHTRFSARVMDCLEAGEKRGAQYENGQTTGWTAELRDFNQAWVQEKTPALTYVDTLAQALRLQAAPLSLANRKSSGEIWLQVLTSDSKKNWPLPYWRRLGEGLRAQSHTVRVLCAPGDAESLLAYFPAEWIAAWNFTEIRRQKAQARLVVSGDTSVLHFAASESIPTCGLYFGPANPYKTAPRQKEAIVLCGNTDCTPCSHRSPCSRQQQDCAIGASPYEIVTALTAVLEGRAPQASSSFHVYQMSESLNQPNQALVERLGGRDEREARTAFASSTGASGKSI